MAYFLERSDHFPPPWLVPKAVTASGIILTGESRPNQDLAAGEFVALHDTTVSSGPRGHCRIWLEEDRVLICDNGSDNGTWILGAGTPQRVGSFRAPNSLTRGDEIAVGRCRLRLI
jgi:hypothetical protein